MENPLDSAAGHILALGSESQCQELRFGQAVMFVEPLGG